ncbi:hypothetical protein D9M72_302180 [compost metagenome]
MQGLACMAASSAAGKATAPILRLSASTNTGRDGSNARKSCASSVSKPFCEGWGTPAQAPSSEPRCEARRSRSSVCAPAWARAFSRRVLPLPVGPASTM